MAKLYIMGNGFDLHYGLKTRTDDFLDYLKQERVYNEIDDAVEVFAGYGVNWSNFEEDRAYIDFNEIEENQLEYPDYLSDHESDRDGCIFNMREYLNSLYAAIHNALRKMVYKADTTELAKDMEFSLEDAIICFNYTSTIEKVAKVLPLIPIFYIHGCAYKNEELILGYKEAQTDYRFDKYSSPEDGDYYVESQLEEMRRFYYSLKKKRKDCELLVFIENLKNIDEVVVLGHSIGSVDAPYFELINQRLNPRVWNISYYDDNDDSISNANQLSFSQKINLFKW